MSAHTDSNNEIKILRLSLAKVTSRLTDIERFLRYRFGNEYTSNTVARQKFTLKTGAFLEGSEISQNPSEQTSIPQNKINFRLRIVPPSTKKPKKRVIENNENEDNNAPVGIDVSNSNVEQDNSSSPVSLLDDDLHVSDSGEPTNELVDISSNIGNPGSPRSGNQTVVDDESNVIVTFTDDYIAETHDIETSENVEVETDAPAPSKKLKRGSKATRKSERKRLSLKKVSTSYSVSQGQGDNPLHFHTRCDQCGKLISGKTEKHVRKNRRDHMYLHTSTPSFPCTECDKKFYQRNQLTGHFRRIHSDIRNYACVYCSRAFPFKQDLKQHMSTHTGYRPFVCDICGKGFIQSWAFKTHRTTHFPEKPFECKLCDKKYSSSSFLRNHVRTMHERKGPGLTADKLCEICDGTFTTNSGLRKHVLRLHPDSPLAAEIKDKRKRKGQVVATETVDDAIKAID